MGGEDIEAQSILKLKINHPVPELSDNIGGSFFEPVNSSNIGLSRIKKLIKKAAKDPDIVGIELTGNNKPIGASTLLSIKTALDSFRLSGKFIYAYDDYFSQSAYVLASSADSIFMSPLGELDLNGLATSYLFFKDFLDRQGIKMDIFYAGNFKSATEPYRNTEMSEYNRIQTRAYLNDMFNVYQNQITQGRNIDREVLSSFMKQIENRTPEYCQELGLIDGIFYEDEYRDHLKAKLGIDHSESITYVTASKYSNSLDNDQKDRDDSKIAVVILEGEILQNDQKNGIISDQRYFKILEDIRFSDEISAVVLRVNSPGGDALASDKIWRQIELIKASGKKVIASFGDYAASGGYYIACGADSIVSMPNTLTGSIGVFSMLSNVESFLDNKIGIRADSVKTHPFALGITPFYSLNEEEKEKLQKDTDVIYERFLDHVAQGRNMTRDEVHEIAQGRVWSGMKAAEIGLVDVIGDVETAIQLAAESAQIEDYSIEVYPKISTDFWDQILKNVPLNASIELKPIEQNILNQYQKFNGILELKGPQMRLPFILESSN